jgi:DNA-binding transcriptional MerR regulator
MKQTELTKKSVEYYIDKGLISPVLLENGYRDFDLEDIQTLKKVAIYRKLNLSTFEIKQVLKDETNEILQKFAFKRDLAIQKEQLKHSVLAKLAAGAALDEVEIEIKSIEASNTVIEKLLDLFPGYYGRFLTLHFAQFLNEPIANEEQQVALEEVVDFLDKAPDLEFPMELQKFLTESTQDFKPEAIHDLIDSTQTGIENTEQFLADHKEIIDQYMEFKKSDVYKNSPVAKIRELLIQFNETSGYYETFIPAMKRLSRTYAEYSQKLESANQKFLKEYPNYNS